MKQNQITLAKILTYCGTLPLIAAVVSILFPFFGVDAVHVATSYSAIIISFLYGIHWAAYLYFSEQCPRNLLLTSNIIALIAWISLLLTYQPTTILLQSLCFLYLLALDLKLREAGIIPEWFYGLRRNATIIVVLSLALLVGVS